MMLKLQQHHYHPPLHSPPFSPHYLSISKLPIKLSLPYKYNAFSSSISSSSFKLESFKVSNVVPSFWGNEEEEESLDDTASGFLDDLAPDSLVYQKTLRLVECSMFAAVSGLTYLLSNSLAIENYFGCFFALPIVISSMRWGVAAGRKTMVATAVLLLVLSGPVKALTYVLMHGLLGFTMGSLWSLQVNWRLSIFLCTLVRAIGALGYVLTSSFLIRENILALITINVHATLTLISNSLGFNTVPSMNTIYGIFGVLLLLNCSFFVFLLHIIYALFLTRLGMKASLVLPRWLMNAL
ncbi:hypothetical protein BVRB_6g140600 [Beta vulgaris subsp. vulgaris]|uniref:uncharacterized protein LOC104896309 isoform X1 n=1 Tax=Beta vulgaris subsp. vulgaris TaxID=3555 RepID=UPI0005403198|nr:uncharacterized protein LOC104896309 isoform X1 [Beta vulgaris subsp. vulgaris]KMT08381.1 hypothetical protein BVRB_6g140600 [Beta vulgaris subsp. vulgaris]